MPSPSHQEIESLAHQLWEDRGCPIGTPEEDWSNAERKLTENPPTGLQEIAREVGSTLGVIAGMWREDREQPSSPS
jgi:hypothetical protein